VIVNRRHINPAIAFYVTSESVAPDGLAILLHHARIAPTIKRCISVSSALRRKRGRLQEDRTSGQGQRKNSNSL
jgi:hypothetical protein